MFQRQRHQRKRMWSSSLYESTTQSSESQCEVSSEMAPEEQTRRSKQLSVFAILASSFLNLLGFTMAGPITPALGKHFALQVGASFGSLTSAYPLGMLFGLLVWPYLSDKIGRKRIMAASLWGSGLGLAAQSIVVSRNMSLPWFLAMRAMTGAFAGNSPVAKAYLADIASKNDKLPRYLAWRDASSTMAFIVGPILGGLMYELRKRLTGNAEKLTGAGSLSFVIGISAIASLIAALLVGWLVEDVPSHSKNSMTPKEMTGTGSNGSVEARSAENDNQACPLGQRMWTGVVSICVISFLFNIGDSTFHAFFSALLRDGAGVSAGNIGFVYTILACVSFTVSTMWSSRLLKTWGPVVTCAAGLSCMGTGLAALGIAASNRVSSFPPSISVLAGSAALYYCGVPLYGPTIPTMLLKCVPPHRRGAIMGLDGTINTIGRVVSPLAIGEVYRRSGAGAAFGTAASMAFVGAITAVYRRFVVIKGHNNSNNNSNPT